MPGFQNRLSSILGRAIALPSHTRGGSRMRESRPYGSVRGARDETRVPTATVSRLPVLACAVQRRRFPVGASPTRQPLQPEAIGAVMEVTKWLKPSISVSRIGGSASVQAATRVNVEQASKRKMCRPIRLPYRGRLKQLGELSEEYAQLLHRGIGGGMYTRKAYATREAPWRGQR